MRRAFIIGCLVAAIVAVGVYGLRFDERAPTTTTVTRTETVVSTVTVTTSTEPPGGAWWDPYDDSTRWKRPLPASPALDPDSGAKIRRLLANLGTPNMSLHAWTVAVAREPEASTRRYDVSILGYPYPRSVYSGVPIPAGTTADPSADGSLAVYDPSTHSEWCFYHAAYDGTQWTADAGQWADTRTDGIAPAGTTGCTAANFPMLPTLIRPEEIADGRIGHALAFANRNSRTGYVCPATHGTGNTTDPLALPAGTLLQLDPAVNVAGLNVEPWEKTVARAMQEFGMYLRDGGGNLQIYAENPVNRITDPWAQLGLGGTYATFSPGFPWARLRVLEPTCE